VLDIGTPEMRNASPQGVWKLRFQALEQKLANLPSQDVRDALALPGSWKHRSMNVVLHVLRVESVVAHNDREGHPTPFNGGQRVQGEEPRRAAINRSLERQRNGLPGTEVGILYGGWEGWHIVEGRQQDFRQAWALLHQMELDPANEVCASCRDRGAVDPECRGFHRFGYSGGDYKQIKDNLGVGTKGMEEFRFGGSPLGGRRNGGAANTHSNSKVLNAQDKYVAIPFTPSFP
jgi:hypothetical protein